MSDVLTKLFGSPGRVKILKLFILNPETAFTRKEIRRRARSSAHTVTKEINLLKKIKLIVPKVAKVEGKRSKPGFKLNENFVPLTPLKNLLINTEPFSDNEILRRLRSTGVLKLVIVAGIFIQEDSRADIIVVGDRLNRAAIEGVFRIMEAEIGKELEYAVLTTKEFEYRLSVYDKFIRDVLDYPHRKVLDKLGI